MATIGSALAEQFERGFAMLGENIGALSDEQWLSEDLKVPARWAYHAIRASSSYNRATMEEPFPQLECNWEGEVGQLPSREETLNYLETVRCGIHDRLLSMPAGWFSEPTAFGWTGKDRLGQFVYSLRHLLYHSGEVSMALRMSGAEETAWA